MGIAFDTSGVNKSAQRITQMLETLAEIALNKKHAIGLRIHAAKAVLEHADKERPDSGSGRPTAPVGDLSARIEALRKARLAERRG